MPDWDTSFFSRKCFHCGKKIKRKTPHIVIWGFEGGVDGRYCDPHCAYLAKKAKRKKWVERERLNKIINGE